MVATVRVAMSISLEVTLMSGRSTKVNAPIDICLDDLRGLSQRGLHVGAGRLLAATGEVLRGTRTISQAGIRAGDVLTLQVDQVRVAAGQGAFAALLGDGSAVAWGGFGCSTVDATILTRPTSRKFNPPGHSSHVQEQLVDVRELQAAHGALCCDFG